MCEVVCCNTVVNRSPIDPFHKYSVICVVYHHIHTYASLLSIQVKPLHIIHIEVQDMFHAPSLHALELNFLYLNVMSSIDLIFTSMRLP